MSKWRYPEGNYMGLDCRERIDVAMQRLGSLAKDVVEAIRTD